MTALRMHQPPKQLRPRHASTQWSRAYGVTALNALIFLVASALIYFSGGTDTNIDLIPAIAFFIGAIVSFGLLVRSGGELAAISFFVLGAGIFFGFGTIYSVLSDNVAGSFLFARNIQIETLPAINLINAASVCIVLFTAWPLCRQGPKKGNRVARMKEALSLLNPLRIPLLLLAVPLVLLQIYTFPQSTNLVLRTILSNIENLTLLAILLCSMQWTRLGAVQRGAVILLVAALATLGFLSLSKTGTLVPLMAFSVGLLVDARSRKTFVVLFVATTVAYFSFIADTCNDARNHPAFSPTDNTIAERVRIITDTLNSPAQDTGDKFGSSVQLLQRFGAAPVQAFLIRQHDNGAPGDSMADAWQALIPRILWPEKPNITRFGAQLDILFYSRTTGQSQLAPTYTAEAYWNSGWFGVLLVSILIGFELGWFTEKWHRFTRGDSKQSGIIAFSIPVSLFALWVEAWVVATYVGGFMTLLILVKLADITVPLLRAQRMVILHSTVSWTRTR